MEIPAGADDAWGVVRIASGGGWRKRVFGVSAWNGEAVVSASLWVRTASFVVSPVPVRGYPPRGGCFG